MRPPAAIAKWEGQRSYLCDRCLLPCPGADVTCECCNIVLHEGCLRADELKVYSSAVIDMSTSDRDRLGVAQLSPPRSPQSPSRRRNRSPTMMGPPQIEPKSYICSFCREDQNADKVWFDAEKKRLWEKENNEVNAQLIGRVLRGFLTRFRYKRYQRAVVSFQATLRCYIEHRKFKVYRRWGAERSEATS